MHTAELAKHLRKTHGLREHISFCFSSNFSFWLTPNLHPVMFQGNLWRRPKSRIYFLVYDFSSFHPNNFRDTISWECFVKNDSVRSCLIELQSFLQSKVDVDPIHRILMFLPCFVCTYCARRDASMSIVSGSTSRKKEYCLSVAQNLSSRYQS